MKGGLFMKKKLISCILCGVMALALLAGCGTADKDASANATTSAADETYQLTVISHDPRTSATGEFLEAWAASVKEASDGRLTLILKHNAVMAAVDESYDYVLEGKADIAWGLQSAYENEFPVTSVFTLPMLDIEDAVHGSTALWNFYKETDYMDEEYAPFHVLLLHTNCQSPISTVDKKVQTVEELAGMNIRANNGPATLFVDNLNANPEIIPITELYPALKTDECHAMITDWHAIRTFGLNSICNYYLDENIGVGTYFMIMNQNSYDSLPTDLQQILDETSAAAIQYTSIWNAYESEVRKLITDIDPRAIYTLSEEEETKLQAVAAETAEDWIKRMNVSGYDGQAIYDKAVECIEQAK